MPDPIRRLNSRLIFSTDEFQSFSIIELNVAVLIYDKVDMMRKDLELILDVPEPLMPC